MSEHDNLNDPSTGRTGLTELLTPAAAGIAGFTFAVFSMLGQGSWSIAIPALAQGSGFPESQFGHVLSMWGVGSLLMAVIGFCLCLFSVRHDGGLLNHV